MKLEIQTMLVLSTAHLKHETTKALDVASTETHEADFYTHTPNEPGLAGVMRWHGYGWIVGVTSDCLDRERFPDLAAAFALADEHRCAWVRFDCDADEIEGLPVYEWPDETTGAIYPRHDADGAGKDTP